MSLGRHLVSFAVLLTNSNNAIAAPASPVPCSREWATAGTVSGGKFYALGLGVSTKEVVSEARDDARARALQDVAMQLRANVSSKVSLTETEASTMFSGSTSVNSSMDNLFGVKILKEGKSPSEGITHCVAVRLDVRAAYENAKSALAGVFAQADSALALLRGKKWMDLIKESGSVIGALKGAEADALKADVFKAYLQEPGQSNAERLSSTISQIEAAEKAAREKITILVSENQYAGAVSDICSVIRDAGVSVVKTKSEAKPGSILLSLEIRDVGTPRKTRTQLGLTLQKRIEILVKDPTGKPVGGNKGLTVSGTSSNDSEDDAVENVERQLVAHIREAINSAIPSLIP